MGTNLKRYKFITTSCRILY